MLGYAQCTELSEMKDLVQCSGMFRMKFRSGITMPFICLSLISQQAVSIGGEQSEVLASWKLGKALSEFRVGFCLLSGKQRQYVAYYDEQRRMTVAARAWDSEQWVHQVLPSRIGWDSHNYVTMAEDDSGHLHVSGNMHCVPLVYFRTTVTGDITTLVPAKMTDVKESKVTYPQFLRTAEGRLLFTYRDGGSGNGVQYYNQYDEKTATWSRFLKEPLLDGEGETNAYASLPRMGPDGWFHMVWVWRDTPDCATNHHLSHARSRDLKNWESIHGDKVSLPITIAEKSLWVDPIPPQGGIINGGFRLAFDRDGRPVIAYHKNDANGHMQLYAAKPVGGRWQSMQLTQWDKVVEFSGGGSMKSVGIGISRFERIGDSAFLLHWSHRDYRSGVMQLDDRTLLPLKQSLPVLDPVPSSLKRLKSQFPEMGVHTAADLGCPPEPGVVYRLQWESLGANNDRPRSGPLPEPSELWLHKIRIHGP